MELDRETLAAMPKALRDVAVYAGQDAAEALLKHFAGQRLYIPKTPSDNTLAPLGRQLAERLIEAFGGEMLAIPSKTMTAAARWDRIRELARAGHSVNEIAAKVGCSYRRVQQVMAQDPACRPGGRRAFNDPRQGKLF